MKPQFDLKRYMVNAPVVAEPEISVSVLKSPFRIAPIGEETNINFYLCNRERGWWLVNPELAESETIQGLYMGKLYPALRADGGLSMLPVTFPNVGYSPSWFNAWQEIIPAARQKWIKLTSNKLAGRHEYEVVSGLPKPEWPDLSYSEWVTLAFKDKVMDELPVSAIAEMPKRRTIHLEQLDRF